MSAVLVDTGPLYALAVASDQYHQHARFEAEILANERLRIVVSFSTVVECYSLLLRRASPGFTSEWFDALRVRVGLLNPTEDDYFEDAELIRRFEDQSITLADGVLAVLSRRRSLSVWSYDYHLDVLGTPRWRPIT